MSKILTVLLVTSCWFLPSCASWPTAEQLETWKTNTDKALAAAGQIADGAKAVADAANAKIASLEAKQAEIIGNVEAIAGPLDKNGDGDVTLAEARSTYSELSKTPEGQNLLANWETYAAVIASVLGIGVAKKGGAAALAKLHATGRALVDKDGDGIPDA